MIKTPSPLILPAILLLGLAACNDARAGNEVDVAAAAARGQSDIANYVADAPAHRQTLVAPAPVATSVPAAGNASAVAATPTETLEAPDALVRRYVAAIAARRYGEAFRLWEGHGQASGMSEAAFAASFAKYARYDAVVGAPYDPDAGAGQRYVSVPVTVTGTLVSGAPFRLSGPAVLHRVADEIDADDPDVHLWRIRSSEMKPRPATEPTADR